MGLPNTYSTELPERCHDLLKLLMPVVQEDGESSRSHGGALTTTLTLALATPMLVIPIERIQKHVGQGDGVEGYADDRHLAAGLTNRIEAAIKGKRLSAYPEFAELDWSYVSEVSQFNVAHGLSKHAAGELSSQKAKDRAKEMHFATFLSCLRNGLAHGGVVYLNDHGETSYGEASMLCFVSARHDYSRPKCDPLDGRCPTVMPQILNLRLLRISENGFRQFLARWVHWLTETELANVVAAE